MLYSIKPIVNHDKSNTLFNSYITAAMNIHSLQVIDYVLWKSNIKFTRKEVDGTPIEYIVDLSKEQAKILYGLNYQLKHL